MLQKLLRRIVCLGMAAFTLLGGVCLVAAATVPSKPNIVVIVADDLGYADVGWHGTEIKTPNLDKLAKEGVRLEQFYVQPVCSPTRASLMTGRYPMRYGLQVGVVRPIADYGLSLEERTLANALQEAGYYTAICGKWHLGHCTKEYLPTQRGFDYQFGHYNGALDYYTHYRDGGLDWHRNDKPVTEEGYTTDLLSDDAARRIREHKFTEKPMFLYVPYNAVHSPYQDVPEVEKWNQVYSGIANSTRRTYAGMVAVMDAGIGRIVAALDEKGVRDNTLIFFCSDNGGPSPKRITDNGILRAGKATLYEGGVRVPAIAIWPGKIPANSQVNTAIHIVDLYPTLVGIAGGSVQQKLPLDGVDVKSVICTNAALPARAILHNATPRSGALQYENWKIIVNGQIDANDLSGNLTTPNRQTVELFNLADDIGEQTNLAQTMPEKVKEMLVMYDKFAAEAVPPLSKPGPPDFKVPSVWGLFD